MEFYLRRINPIVALAILLICTWIWLGGYFLNFDGGETSFQEGVSIIDPSEMGFSLYFFAKGLFCSAMLLLFGEFLRKYLAKS
jgi:hypothetical protein